MSKTLEKMTEEEKKEFFRPRTEKELAEKYKNQPPHLYQNKQQSTILLIMSDVT